MAGVVTRGGGRWRGRLAQGNAKTNISPAITFPPFYRIYPEPDRDPGCCRESSTTPPHILPPMHRAATRLFHPCTIPALCSPAPSLHSSRTTLTAPARSTRLLSPGENPWIFVPCPVPTRLASPASCSTADNQRTTNAFICVRKTRPHDSRLLCITPRPPKSPDEKPCAYENANLRCRRRDEKRKSNRIIRKRTRIKAILGTSRQVGSSLTR